MRKFADLILLFACIAILLVSLFLFAYGLTYVSNLPEKEAQMIHIRANGDVEAISYGFSSAPINREGDLYRFTTNTELEKVFIEKSNVVLDGNGFSIKIGGHGEYPASSHLGQFEVSNVENVTFRNIDVGSSLLTFKDCSACKVVNSSGFFFAIKNSHNILVSESTGGDVELTDSTDCVISSSNLGTITLKNSHNNKILSNNMTYQRFLALRLEDSTCNLFFGNSIERAIKLFEIMGNSGSNLFVGNFVQGAFGADPTLTCSGINTFYHNNFVYVYWNKTIATNSLNMWDNGA
jgi:parallel beta-helix repeat protein